MTELRQQAEEYAAAEVAGETLNDEQQEIVTTWEETRAFMAPTAEDTQKDLEVHAGGYVDILVHRAPLVASMQFFMIFIFGIWRVGGLMLLVAYDDSEDLVRQAQVIEVQVVPFGGEQTNHRPLAV